MTQAIKDGIIMLYETGHFYNKEIAKIVGVCETQVSLFIRNYQTEKWKAYKTEKRKNNAFKGYELWKKKQGKK